MFFEVKNLHFQTNKSKQLLRRHEVIVKQPSTNNLHHLKESFRSISLISHVPPAHYFFQKKSILINLTQNLVQLFLTLTKKLLKIY